MDLIGNLGGGLGDEETQHRLGNISLSLKSAYIQECRQRRKLGHPEQSALL
jgi:hypothetical protein